MARLTTSLQPGDLSINSSTAQLELGTIGETADGRRFRYVRAGATALVPGVLYQSAAETTTWQDLDVAAASAGATSITTTSTLTATLNQLAGGYVVVTNDSSYPGYLYKIKGNTAASAAVCTITLEEPLRKAIVGGTSSDIDIILSPYDRVEIWDYSNHDGTPVGVGVGAITATYYGWLQVGGPAALLIDSGNITVGANVYASAAVNGCGDATSTYGWIGTAMTGGSSTEYAMVNLNIN